MHDDVSLSFSQIIDIPLKFKKYISSVRVVDERIWISTVGSGLFVYNANTLQYEASWGDSDRENVYNLLDVKDARCMIALTNRGIFSFGTELDSSTFFDCLDYQNRCSDDFGGLAMNVGVVIPATGNVKNCEVWVCSHSERKFYVLTPLTLKVLNEVECSDKDLAAVSRKDLVQQGCVQKGDVSSGSMIVRIKEMQVVNADFHVKLAVADNCKILLWDVESQKLERVFDCWEYCKSHQDEFQGMSCNSESDGAL